MSADCTPRSKASVTVVPVPSGHALALYENCYRFVRTGSTGWWPLDLFRRLMGVDDSVYYETFKHLNAKIIKPAVAEVNE